MAINGFFFYPSVSRVDGGCPRAENKYLESLGKKSFKTELFCGLLVAVKQIGDLTFLLSAADTVVICSYDSHSKKINVLRPIIDQNISVYLRARYTELRLPLPDIADLYQGDNNVIFRKISNQYIVNNNLSAFKDLATKVSQHISFLSLLLENNEITKEQACDWVERWKDDSGLWIENTDLVNQSIGASSFSLVKEIIDNFLDSIVYNNDKR